MLPRVLFSLRVVRPIVSPAGLEGGKLSQVGAAGRISVSSALAKNMHGGTALEKWFSGLEGTKVIQTFGGLSRDYPDECAALAGVWVLGMPHLHKKGFQVHLDTTL